MPESITKGRALPLLTNSGLRTWRSCQRKYQFRYVMGYRPVAKSEALDFGTAVHLALEGWWTWHKLRLDGTSAFDLALTMLSHAGLEPYADARAKAMIAGYHARWMEFASSVTVLEVEPEFRMPLANPATGRRSRAFDLGGKLDLIVQLADGTVAIIEHKTSSETLTPGSTYRSRLLMDSQISTYYAGAEALGYSPSLCIYDVLGKPKQRPLLGRAATLADPEEVPPEDPEDYLDRCVKAIAADPDRYLVHIEVVRLHSERQEWEREVWQQAQNIISAKKAAIYPRTPESCYSYNSACSYYPVCTAMTSLDNTSQFTQSANVNVELSNV